MSCEHEKCFTELWWICSPNQLVFGRNVKMPTVLEDKLPALESNASSDNS